MSTRSGKSESVALEEDGFRRVGWIALGTPSTFSVNFDFDAARSWRNAIYAFRIGGAVVRIGVAAILIQKMVQLEKDLSRALAGEFRTGGPNPWETYEWRRRLARHRIGEFWAQPGPANQALAARQERKLILKYDPCLSNDGPTGRKRPADQRMVRDIATAKTFWNELNSDALPPPKRR